MTDSCLKRKIGHTKKNCPRGRAIETRDGTPGHTVELGVGELLALRGGGEEEGQAFKKKKRKRLPGRGGET